jgi:putative ATP-dependent endonuclease of the OLD family
LIEEELLRELNVIINPDIKFNRILVQEDENNRWEIYFEDFMLNRIQLSRMGSGIKTILLVLLNLIVRPKIENNDRNVYVYAFEELENNLHPSLQRRLYNYIIKYSENHLTYFFITTHSNVVIDVFSSYEKSQLIHVLNNGSFSRTNTILSKAGTKHILDDLGLKASDILQSNGVIWVEGPSDRNYINKWIKTLCPELSEGMHYLVMFYGGRLLSNLTFDIDWFNEEVIPLLRINKNAFVVIDRDGKKINDNINETKSRIVKEIGVNSCWVTSGREIENYLSSKIVSRWLLEKHKVKVDFTQDKYVKIEENILKSGDKIRVKYNESKTVYSSELSKYIDIESLDILDLRENLEKLVEKIKLWNELG